MNNRINVSNWNQSLHQQPALEYLASSTISFSDLQPITNVTEYTACLYRAETSNITDLRIPSSTSGEVQLSGEHNSTALTQGHLEQKKTKQKLIPVPPEYRFHNEDEHTRIRSSALLKRKRDMKRVPVPLEYRLRNEDEHTRISLNALTLRKRNRKPIPVPPEYRFHNENEHTRISPNALSLRMCNSKLVPVPPEYRLHNEDEHTLISCGVLEGRKRKRRRVPVPREYRLYDEDEHTLISLNALDKRKRKKLKSAASSDEKPHASHQAGETSVANTLTDRNSARQSSPVLTRSSSGLNASTLHETTLQDTMETDKTLPPFESETAFSHWLDDLNAQQSAIDYIQNCHW